MIIRKKGISKKMKKFLLAIATLAAIASPANAQLVTSGSDISVGTSTLSGTQDSQSSRTLDIVGTVNITQVGGTASASGEFSAAELATNYDNVSLQGIFADSVVTPVPGNPTGSAQSSTSFEGLTGTDLVYTLNQTSTSSITGGTFSNTTTNNSVRVFAGL